MKIDTDLWPVTDRRRFFYETRNAIVTLLSPVDCTSVIMGLTFGTIGRGILRILLATRSPRGRCDYRKQLGHFSRHNRNCESNVAIVFTLFVCVLKNLPPVSQPLGNSFFLVKSRKRWFARNQCFQMWVYVISIVIMRELGGEGGRRSVENSRRYFIYPYIHISIFLFHNWILWRDGDINVDVALPNFQGSFLGSN